jgi:formylglycine-generating enzyme required for sulfatase activity
VSKEIFVHGYCPAGMVSVVREEQKTFCIDRYEWPNRAGEKPDTGVSWIQARMHCADEGKRLCTSEEWRYACSGGSDIRYPYGNIYDAKRCPSFGTAIWPSGHFTSCHEGFGLSDMQGNAWEWVSDKNGMKALMAGGSYKDGASAHCGQVSQGTIIENTENVGFRCCK